MPFNVLLLPLLGGFVLVTRWNSYAGTSFLAFMIGLVAWKPLNWWSPRERAVRAAVAESNDFLEMLLNESIANTLMVSLSLKSGKVYIGFVTSNFDPAYDRKFVRLWPILSGYRNKDTHELALTTNYANVYSTLVTDNADVDRFQVIVPVGEFQTASFFDPNTYSVFNPSAEPLMT